MNDSTPNAKSNPAVQWYVWAALAVVVVRLWIQPMSSSFWLDETGTFLIVQGSFAQMLAKCARWVGQPTFFAAIVWPFAQLPGPREVIFRIPSLIGLSLATIFVYRIGKRLLGIEAARAAVLIFAALSAFYASDARPYALGLMAASGAVLFLIRWMDDSALIDAICYAFFAALTVYFHFLFGAMFLVHGGYILLRYVQGTRPRLRDLMLAAALIPILLIPLAPSFFRVTSVRGSFNFIPKPRLASIVLDSFPEYFYAFLVAGFLAVILLFSGVKFSRPKSRVPEVWLLIGWALVPPSILYLISYLTPTSVFVERYFAVALPGLALSLAYVVSGFEPAAARTILVLTLAAGAVLDRGGPLRTLGHHAENWRDALATVNKLTDGNAMPILVHSDFVESNNPSMFTDPGQAGFLLAPLIAYPTSGIPIPLPMDADEKALVRLESIVEQIILRGDRFILITKIYEGRYRMWLKGRLHSTSFVDRDLGNFGTVAVYLFERK